MFFVTVTKPNSLTELWGVLKENSGPHVYLCGGTDLVVRARARLEMPDNWIDISDLPELQGITESDGHIHIGAGVKIAEIGQSPIVKKWLPALYDACSKFASPPLRNMATLGGNCANASPSADGVCALIAEGAIAVITSSRGSRKLPVEEIATGPKKNSLRADELITGFEIPKTVHKGGYYKIATRKAYSISKVAVAACVWDKGGAVHEARLAVASCAPVVVRARRAEERLRGIKLDDAAVGLAAETAKEEFNPINDMRSTAAYRKAMIATAMARCLGGLRA